MTGGLALALLGIVSACGSPRTEDRRTADLHYPTWQECADAYGYGEGSAVDDFLETGATQAGLCTLTLGSEPTGATLIPLIVYYTIYRLEGVEPAALDPLVRGMDRRTLATDISLAHDMVTVLDPIASRRFTGCPDFDATARELLRRSIPSEDMSCMPHGRR